jgi:hypothetical protein
VFEGKPTLKNVAVRYFRALSAIAPFHAIGLNRDFLAKSQIFYTGLAVSA